MKGRRRRSSRRPRAGGVTRRRVTQEMINQMTELRRQGVTHKEIGERLGCSERTSRRCVGKVEPQLRLPGPDSEPEVGDPRQVREELARWFSEAVYNAQCHPRPRESVAFLAESNRLILDRLADMDHLTSALLHRDPELRRRFLREVLGPLYADFHLHVTFDANIGCIETSVSAAGWRPPRERPPAPVIDEDEIDDYEPGPGT